MLAGPFAIGILDADIVLGQRLGIGIDLVPRLAQLSHESKADPARGQVEHIGRADVGLEIVHPGFGLVDRVFLDRRVFGRRQRGEQARGICIEPLVAGGVARVVDRLTEEEIVGLVDDDFGPLHGRTVFGVVEVDFVIPLAPGQPHLPANAGRDVDCVRTVLDHPVLEPADLFGREGAIPAVELVEPIGVDRIEILRVIEQPFLVPVGRDVEPGLEAVEQLEVRIAELRIEEEIGVGAQLVPRRGVEADLIAIGQDVAIGDRFVAAAEIAVGRGIAVIDVEPVAIARRVEGGAFVGEAQVGACRSAGIDVVVARIVPQEVAVGERIVGGRVVGGRILDRPLVAP